MSECMDVYQEKKFDDNKDWLENFEKLRKFCKLYFSKMQRKIFNKKLLKESVIKVLLHLAFHYYYFYF